MQLIRSAHASPVSEGLLPRDRYTGSRTPVSHMHRDPRLDHVNSMPNKHRYEPGRSLIRRPSKLRRSLSQRAHFRDRALMVPVACSALALTGSPKTPTRPTQASVHLIRAQPREPLMWRAAIRKTRKLQSWRWSSM